MIVHWNLKKKVKCKYMITKNELAENMHNALTVYKKMFKKFQNDKINDVKNNYSREKVITNISGMISAFYIEDELLSIVSNNKQESIKNIILGLDTKDTLVDLESLIQNAIEVFTPLDELDQTMLFFYDKVDKEICKDVVIEKFGNGYLKYWNLFVLMNVLENNIINYRQSLTN